MKLIETLISTLPITITTNFIFLEKIQRTKKHKTALKKVIYISSWITLSFM